jgi:hypothetical protein
MLDRGPHMSIAIHLEGMILADTVLTDLLVLPQSTGTNNGANRRYPRALRAPKLFPYPACSDINDIPVPSIVRIPKTGDER